MNIKFKHSVFLFLFALLSLTACQDESAEVNNPDTQETLEPSSVLANLMSRASANFGAADDILDDSSCFSVQLPVTIVVSDITIVIETESDLEQLEDIFDAIEDEYILDFIFPITIIFSDYSEIVIENEEQLESFIDQCDAEDDDVIECVDFIYPISFSVFDSEFNTIDTVVIENDQELYVFLDGLEDDNNTLIVSLNYPVILEYAYGETVEVNSNQELAEAIEIAQDDCDDDEENDCNEEEIAELLIECPWDIEDEFNDFDNYQFVFSQDGTLAITEGETTTAIGGAWNLSVTDNGILLTIAELTAFQDDLGGTWLITACDDDELVIERNDFIIVLEQDCEDDLDCTAPEINANLIECAWLLETNLIDSVIAIYVYFSENGMVLNANQDNTESEIGNYDVTIINSEIYIELNLEDGFEVLNGLWEVVECEDGNLYLIKDDNYIELQQDCDFNEGNEVFDCFGDYELVECANDAGEAEFNLSAETIGLTDCQYEFIPSFHTSQTDAEGDLGAISNTESYYSVSGEVYLRIEANNGNFEIFTIYLNAVECNLFECFQSFDAVIGVCDENNDDYEVFNLTTAFANCTPEADVVTYHETQQDADAYNNAIANPEAYINISTEQVIYVRVEIDNQFEVFPIVIYVEDCDEGGCSEEDVDAFLTECIWNIVNFNGDDNLIEYNFDFEMSSQIVVIYSNDLTIDATWTTSQSDEGVIIEFSNVAGPEIQAITGGWLVVECEIDRLQLQRENDFLVLEQNCD